MGGRRSWPHSAHAAVIEVTPVQSGESPDDGRVRKVRPGAKRPPQGGVWTRRSTAPPNQTGDLAFASRPDPTHRIVADHMSTMAKASLFLMARILNGFPAEP